MAAAQGAVTVPRVRLAEEATEGKMITSPVAATEAATVVNAEATATVPAEAAVLEVVTKAVATAVAPATRVVIIAKVTERWLRRRIPSSCRE